MRKVEPNYVQVMKCTGSEAKRRRPRSRRFSALHCRTCRRDIEATASQVAKSPLATREHYYLEILRLARQGIEHPLDAVVVSVDDGVVENAGRGRARIGQHTGEGKPYEQRYLLLRTTRENIEILLRSRPHQGCREHFLRIEAEFGLRPEELQKRAEFH